MPGRSELKITKRAVDALDFRSRQPIKRVGARRRRDEYENSK